MTTATLQRQQNDWFSLLDDWLKRDRFIFIGWSGLLLLPTAYLAIGGWFTGTTTTGGIGASAPKNIPVFDKGGRGGRGGNGSYDSNASNGAPGGQAGGGAGGGGSTGTGTQSGGGGDGGNGRVVVITYF